MNTVVLSPHTDDAVFSIGAHLCSLDDKTVISPMAGIPVDVAGKAKHETLHAEHATALSMVGADHVNGPFLDDVYPPPDPQIFSAWLRRYLTAADVVYVPVGIHHPDHVMVSNAAIAHLLYDRQPTVRFYAELPYRLRYPGLMSERLDFIRGLLGTLVPVEVAGDQTIKAAAVRAYASQTDDDLIAELLVPELIWVLC